MFGATAALTTRQQAEGFWVNSADRWEESNPKLVTVYSLLALEEALKLMVQVGDWTMGSLRRDLPQ